MKKTFYIGVAFALLCWCLTGSASGSLYRCPLLREMHFDSDRMLVADTEVNGLKVNWFATEVGSMSPAKKFQDEFHQTKKGRTKFKGYRVLHIAINENREVLACELTD